MQRPGSSNLRSPMAEAVTRLRYTETNSHSQLCWRVPLSWRFALICFRRVGKPIEQINSKAVPIKDRSSTGSGILWLFRLVSTVSKPGFKRKAKYLGSAFVEPNLARQQHPLHLPCFASQRWSRSIRIIGKRSRGNQWILSFFWRESQFRFVFPIAFEPKTLFFQRRCPIHDD